MPINTGNTSNSRSPVKRVSGSGSASGISPESAFEYYYSLGPSRTLLQVANHYGVHRVTLSRWAAEFNWRARIAEVDGSVKNRIKQRAQEVQSQRDAAELTEADLAESRKKLVVLVNELITQAQHDLEAGKLRIKSVADLQKVEQLFKSVSTDYNTADAIAVAFDQYQKELHTIASGIASDDGASDADTDLVLSGIDDDLADA